MDTVCYSVWNKSLHSRTMESFHENNNSSVYCVKLSLIQQVYTTYYLNTNTILRNISVSRNLTREFNKNVLEKLKQNLFVYNCLDNRTNKMRKRKEITYPQKWQLLRKFPHLLVLVIAQIVFHQNLWFHTQNVAEFLHKSPSCIYEIFWLCGFCLRKCVCFDQR